MRGRMLRKLGLVCAVVAVAVLAANCKKSSSSKKPGPQPGTPTVTNVFPATGDVAGGTTVTIVTTDFQDDFLVDAPLVFFGTDAATNVTALSSAAVTADSPPHAVEEAVDVRVDSTGIAETATDPGAFTYTAAPPPPPCTITAVTPSQGYWTQTTTVIIDGTNFDTTPVPTVEFGAGNLGLNVLSIGPTRIQADAPTAASAGFVDVIVTNQSSSCTDPSGFEYIDPPPPPQCNIISINPTFGPDTGGTVITINGTGFTAGCQVWLGGVDVTASRVYFDPTRMEITSPPGTGSADVSVDIGGGGTCNLAAAFDYITCGGPACNIQNVTPATGSVGQNVTITGTGFEVGSLVFFGTEQSPVVDDSGAPTTLVAQAPAPGPGPLTVDIDVMGPTGSCCTEPGGFTYGGCVLLGISPNSGPPQGGQPVTITWQGCNPGPPLPTVTFGVNAATVISADGNSITCTTPAGSGTVDVTVVDASSNVGTLPSGYTYGGCSLSSITPSTGGTNGGTPVTILGTGFDPFSLKVTFGGYYADPANVTFTATRIDLITPPSPIGGAVTVEVVNETLGTQCTTTFTYNLPGAGACSITSLNPTVGPLSGGQSVTIAGSGFDANTGVLIGLMPALSVSYDPGTGNLSILTPPYVGPILPEPISVDVVVCPQNSNPCSLTNGYAFQTPACPGGCTINTLNPPNGPLAGGNSVTINGSGFCDNATVVLFGGQMAPVVQVMDANTINVTVPAGTAAGPADVVYADGSGCFTVCFGCYTYN